MRFTKSITIGLVLILLLMQVVSASAAEAEPTPSMDDINEVAKDLFCPVCENNPLDQCGSQACIDMRAEIGILLQQGKTEAEIQAYFIDYHGDRVVSAPPARGINILLYIAGPIVIIIGGFLLLKSMRSWISKPAPVEVIWNESEQVEDEYISQLEEQLRDRKK